MTFNHSLPVCGGNVEIIAVTEMCLLMFISEGQIAVSLAVTIDQVVTDRMFLCLVVNYMMAILTLRCQLK
jgi:hypothetical protein